MKKYFFFMIFMTIIFGICSKPFLASRELQIVAFGDSITYGTGDPERKGYVERIKVAMEQKGLPSVHISNFGVPKYTTMDILKLLQNKKVVKNIEEANYIILYVGTNDFRQSAQYVFKPLPYKKLSKGKNLYMEHLLRIIHVLRDANPFAPIIVLGLYHPYVEYENQKEIYETIEEWNKGIKKVTQNFPQTYFIPTADLFINRDKKRYFSDSLHLNERGYDLLSERVTDSLLSLEVQQ